MIDSVQNVSTLSFTRQLGDVEKSGSSSSTTQAPGLGEPTAGEPFGGDFEMTLAGIAGDMVADLRAAEQASFAAVAGEATTREVVDAVMTAEQTLRTAIAIRDKIVTAYLEISRMQI